jgi:ribosome-binding factor A
MSNGRLWSTSDKELKGKIRNAIKELIQKELNDMRVVTFV